jgi:hypothetical protein
MNYQQWMIRSIASAFLSLSMFSSMVGAGWGETITLNRQFRPDPLRVEGQTGGNVSLAEIAGGRGCRGFVPDRQPTFTLNLGANFPMLDILAYSNEVNADPTMLLIGENGLVVCADNEHRGRNPQIALRLPKGTYRLWVGNRDANRPIKFTLSVSEINQK